MRPPVLPPTSAISTGMPATSPTGLTLPTVGGQATCGSSLLTSISNLLMMLVPGSLRAYFEISCYRQNDLANAMVFSSGLMNPHFPPTSIDISGNSIRSSTESAFI